MNANDVMKELSKNHTRPPVAALDAAVTLCSEVAPLRGRGAQTLVGRIRGP